MNDDELDALIAATPEPPSSGEHLDDATLLAYVRRTLSAERSAPVERHLAGCAECRALAEGYAIGPSAELIARGKRSLKTTPLFSRGRIIGAAGIAAAAAVLLLVAIPRGDHPTVFPGFAMEGPFGGIQAARDTQEASNTFDANSRVEVIFRPATTAPHVELEARAGKKGEPAVRVDGGAIERGESGALIYRAPAPLLFARGPGTYAVTFQLQSEGSAFMSFELELLYLGEKEQR